MDSKLGVLEMVRKEIKYGNRFSPNPEVSSCPSKYMHDFMDGYAHNALW